MCTRWLRYPPVLLGLLIVASAPARALDCGALASKDFSAVPEAPMQITRAQAVAETADNPAYCQVVGYIAPNIGIEMRLPDAESWNGKFLMQGCGGFCGARYAQRCDEYVTGGYACIVSDMGHQSTGLDAKWAYNNLQAEFDFGTRSTHVTAVAGKALVAAAYGRPHNYAYFTGCSTGGLQGFFSAQRFPNDFDGIVAGAPVLHRTGAGVQLLWSVMANLDENNKPILKQEQLPTVHAAAIAACDADDGLEDGLIDDPRECDFDPAELLCSGEPNRDCLTQAQVDVVRKIYQGPVNSSGEALYTGGAMPGSELNWIGNYVGTDDELPVYYRMMGDMFRYMSFTEDPGPDWDPRNFDFDANPDRFSAMEQLWTAVNPDLRRFQRRGGKLLAYQGWRDQSIVPLNMIDYYEVTTRTMGGLAATREFFRLFMVPGMNHCVGGPGPDSINYLSNLEAWVERGEAPEALIGEHIEDGQMKYRRPMYPYPDRARFRGGDPDDASSFRRIRGQLSQ
jgi:hypothetical protein